MFWVCNSILEWYKIKNQLLLASWLLNTLRFSLMCVCVCFILLLFFISTSSLSRFVCYILWFYKRRQIFIEENDGRCVCFYCISHYCMGKMRYWGQFGQFLFRSWLMRWTQRVPFDINAVRNIRNTHKMRLSRSVSHTNFLPCFFATAHLTFRLLKCLCEGETSAENVCNGIEW